MSYFYTIVELGEKLADLCRDHSEWSQATFGTDEKRSPLGALKHLERESREAQEAWILTGGDKQSGEFEKFREEAADCLLLILDAARRAGIKPMQLIEAAQAKMEVNKKRTWPTPVSDEPVEHVKEQPHG